MNTDRYQSRRERLRASLKDAGLDALLITHAANRYYLSGFELHDPQCNESSGWLLVTASGRDWLLTDPRYETAAKRLWPETDLFIYSAPKLGSIRSFLAGQVRGDLGFEPGAMSVKDHCELTMESDPRLTMVPTTGLVEAMRRIKDAAEIEALRASCALNHTVFGQLEALMEPGMTEKAIAWEAEKLFREQGASELAFPSIVAVDANAALPHAEPGPDRVPASGLVLVDMGARLSEYNSDQTRTFWVGGAPSQRFATTMDQVLRAQQAALDIIRPGLPIKEAYLAARASFEGDGVAPYFTHALGHGIGLETHEGPSLGSRTQGTFEPGMVVTVEPGLYYPDWGGIRWEYMAVVTHDGVEVL